MLKRSIPTQVLLFLNIAWGVRTVVQFIWQLRNGENGFTRSSLVLFSGYNLFFVGYLFDVLFLRRIALAITLIGEIMVDLYLLRKNG